MQNFTFGRKGTNWFLFTFLLLIGTLPSFGQDCATVGDDDSDPNNGNQQSFCYLQTVADIDRTGTNTAIFETNNSENNTQPIDSDEVLTDGITYYVGSTTEDCDRVAVEVTVNSLILPIIQYFRVVTTSACLLVSPRHILLKILKTYLLQTQVRTILYKPTPLNLETQRQKGI